MRKHYFLPLLIFLALAGCKGNSTDQGNSNSVTKAPEADACTTTRSDVSDVTISGTAKYYVRQTNLVLQSSKIVGILGNPSGTAYAIEKAEVQALNSAGQIINCGMTTSSGTFSIKVPPFANYTIKVLSRSADPAGNFSVSVKEDIYSNALYELSAAVTVAGTNVSGVTMLAYARQSESSKVLGGAFNILDRIVKANNVIAAISGVDMSCIKNNKVNVYWKAGFNPNSYRNYPNDPLSYYIPGNHELYILGGKNGDLAYEDTDHFDDSVVVHEYGHFLEDVCGKSDSRGGAHNGNFIIDPRLAWSEGWANYFQTTVSGNKYYIDTIGFSDSQEGGNGQNGITLDLSESGSAASRDAVSTAGEGTFREVSISRALYKMTTSTNPVTFDKVWTAFTSIGSAAEAFRNIGLLHMRLAPLLSGAPLTTFNNTIACAGAGECQSSGIQYYGQRLNTSVPACSPATESLTPVIDSSYGYVRSNQFRSNKFYRLTYNGGGGTLTLHYTGSGSPSTDLDLILYRESYDYSEDSGATGTASIIAQSRTSGQDTAGNYTESINMSGVAAGTYMLNVKARTYGKSSLQIGTGATFNLTLGGNNLCPTSTW